MKKRNKSLTDGMEI